MSSTTEKVRDSQGKTIIKQRRLELNWKNLPEEDTYWVGLFGKDIPEGSEIEEEDSLHTIRTQSMAKGRFRTDVEFPVFTFDATNLTTTCLGFWVHLVNGKQSIVKNCIMTRPSWMGESYEYLKDKALKDIFIPGTHNAGSYEVGYKESSARLLRKYIICQDESIFNQLVYGNR